MWVGRAGTAISRRRRVTPRATALPWPARVPAAWSRLCASAIAAHSAQTVVGQGSVDDVGEHGFDDRVAWWTMSACAAGKSVLVKNGW
jgi:hypothetical protein